MQFIPYSSTGIKNNHKYQARLIKLPTKILIGSYLLSMIYKINMLIK